MYVDRNAYLATFPYIIWRVHGLDHAFRAVSQEDNSTMVPNLCKGYDTCSNCLNNPACGWCDEGNKNGLGQCHEGGSSGPLLRSSVHHKEKQPTSPVPRTGPWTWSNSSACSATEKEWHFTSCPLCQCNGHSICSTPGVCQQPCEHNTQGDHCHSCL